MPLDGPFAPENGPYPKAELRKFQRDAADVLFSLAGIRDTFIRAERESRDIEFGAPPMKRIHVPTLKLSLIGGFGRRRDRSLLTVNGSLRDTFLAVLALELARSSNRAVALCAAPGCGRLFARVRRQRCCSQRCTWRANKAHERARLKTRSRSWRRLGHGRQSLQASR